MSASELSALLIKLSSGDKRILTTVAPAPDQPARERYQIFHDVLAGKVLDWRSRYVKAAEQRAAQAIAEEERRKAEKEARAAAKLFRLFVLAVILFFVAVGFAGYAWRQTSAARDARQKADVAAAEADSSNHAAEARRLEVLAANANTKVLEATNDSLRYEKQAVEARLEGKNELAKQLADQAAAATKQAASSKQDAARFTAEQLKEQQAAEFALTQARQISAGVDKEPAAAANAPAELPKPVPTPAPPVNAEPPTTAAQNPPAAATAPVSASPNVGDYREVYRKAIDAKNRKRWDDAARLFQEALTLRGTDTGERINISGFGNIEPYVPHYYLGLAYLNLKNCQQALANWDLSEKDGAVQKTSLFSALNAGRKQCVSKQ
jgi:hypothetical protein